MGEAEKSEKITVNLGLVDLGQIDLLVGEGFYANRTDFIRTAIRNQLAAHAEAVTHTVARKTLVLGVQHYSRRDLEAVREAGQRLQIRVLELASIAEDVSTELALATIESVEVLGPCGPAPRSRRPLPAASCEANRKDAVRWSSSCRARWPRRPALRAAGAWPRRPR